MKILALLLLAVVALWSQPWSAAGATPRVWRGDGIREMTGKCPSGYHKSTVTARCVRNVARFPALNWF